MYHRLMKTSMAKTRPPCVNDLRYIARVRRVPHVIASWTQWGLHLRILIPLVRGVRVTAEWSLMRPILYLTVRQYMGHLVSGSI